MTMGKIQSIIHKVISVLSATLLVCSPILSDEMIDIPGPVDWGLVMSSPNRVNAEAVISNFSNFGLENLKDYTVRVPILLPPTSSLTSASTRINQAIDPSRIEIKQVIVETDYYVATGEIDGGTVWFYIAGASIITVPNEVKNVPMSTPIEDSNIESWVGEDYGYFSTFTKYGASYEINLYCNGNDVRCREPDFVEKLIESLLVVGR